MQLSAVILAGGLSTRMGRDKAWVQFGGKPLIQRALEVTQGLGIREVFISGRNAHDFESLDCHVLIDLEPGLGPLSGIERALWRATSPLVLVMPVDLPRMTVECLERVLAACDRLTGVVAKTNGELQPLVGVYPKRCHAFAIFNIVHGNYAVHQFAAACLREHAVKLSSLPARYDGCFQNCNYPSDLSE